METTNPLEQLIELTEKIHKNNFDASMSHYSDGRQNYRLLPLISFLLGREMNEELGGKYRERELIEDYTKILKLIENAEEFVSKESNEKSRDRNLMEISGIIQMYKNLNVNSMSHHIVSNGYTHIEKAKTICYNLSHKNNIQLVGESEIQDIVNQLDEVYHDIANSSLRDDIKIKIMDSIFAMKHSIMRINITGCDDAMETYEKLIGQIIRIGVEEQEEAKENSGLLGKLSKALASFRKTFDSVDTAGLALKDAAEIVTRVLSGS